MQLRQCSCGEQTADRICPQCEAVTWPLWDVLDSRGRFRGQVAGDSHRDALESANQSVAFDNLRSFTVREVEQ